MNGDRLTVLTIAALLTIAVVFFILFVREVT